MGMKLSSANSSCAGKPKLEVGCLPEIYRHVISASTRHVNTYLGTSLSERPVT